MAAMLGSTLFAGARGVAKSARQSRRSAVVVKASLTDSAKAGKAYMESLPGISAPTGFFDPLGFTTSATFSVAEAKRFRESELTHGRVAMLAVVGWLVAEEFHPLFGGQIGGPAFRHFQEIEAIVPQFWEGILLAIGLTESYRVARAYNDPKKGGDQLKSDYEPGELGFDPLGLYPTDPEEQFAIKTKEINNGRLAMIAIAGFALQEEVDHITIWKGLVETHFVPANDASLLPF